MSVVSTCKFFYRGYGAILIVSVVIIGVGFVINQGNEKRAAERDKNQKTRELGQVAPKETVDASQAAKEAVLSSRKLSPGFKTEPDQVKPIPNFTVQQQQARALPTLVSFYSQVAATPTPTPETREERKAPEYWLPPSIFIPCALVNTIDSSHINTPVVGEVIRDCYQNGKLIIPAGTIVSCFAANGAVRDRIEVSGTWLFVFADGRQLKVPGIACDREADPSNQQFGITDGSAGLQGELIESDHWSNAKAFIALLMTSTLQAGTAAASGVVSKGYGGGVGLPDTTPILSKYLDQLLNGETGDGRFVRVPASKEFYVFPTDTVLPAHRSIVNGATTKSDEQQLPLSSDPNQQAFQLEREMLRQSRPQESPSDAQPHFHY